MIAAPIEHFCGLLVGPSFEYDVIHSDGPKRRVHNVMSRSRTKNTIVQASIAPRLTALPNRLRNLRFLHPA